MAEGEFGAIARDYLVRLRREFGIRRHIDASGDLWIERRGEPVTSLELRAALSASSWVDAKPVPRWGHRR